MSTVIQLRRDYLSNWETANPILAEGEMVIVSETDGTQSIKVGNGTSDFISLPYFNQQKGVLQVVGTRANYDWGVVGHASPWALSWLDLTLVTKGKNSRFQIYGEYRADDTNSAAFGLGIGSMYSLDNGTTWTYIIYPAAHEQYNAIAADKYMTATLHRLTTTEIQVPKGTTIKFRIMGRFNNSNGQKFLGNGAPFYAQEHIVQEIANV